MAFVVDPELLGLVDEVALVTGGGGIGMGSWHCVQLARAGCHIVVADIDAAGGHSTVKRVEELGRKAVFVQADTRKKADIDRIVDTAFKTFGKLNIAINHVGSAPPETSGAMVTPFLDYTEELWDSMIEQNLKGTMMCCQSEALAMIAHDIPGRIINTASSSGIVGAPTIAAYGAAKAAVIHLTKSLSMELAPYNIRVNCVVPGTHTSERQKARMADPNTPEESKTFMDQAAKAPPLGRLGEPWETAGLVVFFASKLSSYVTGHYLLSDGGVSHTTARPAVGLGIKPAALSKIGKG